MNHLFILVCLFSLYFANICCINPKEVDLEIEKEESKSHLRSLSIFGFLNDLKHKDVVHVHEDYQIGSKTRQFAIKFNMTGKKIIGDYPFRTINITYRNSEFLHVLGKCENLEIHHVHFRILALPNTVLKGSLMYSLSNAVLNDVIIEIANDITIESVSGILAGSLYNTTLLNVGIIFNNMIMRSISEVSIGIISSIVEYTNYGSDNLQYINGVYLKGKKLTIESYNSSDDESIKLTPTSLGLLFGGIIKIFDYYYLDDDDDDDEDDRFKFNDNSLYITNSFVSISELVFNTTKADNFSVGGFVGIFVSPIRNVVIDKCFVDIKKIQMVEPVSVFGYIIGRSASKMIINNTWVEMNFDRLNMKDEEYMGIVGDMTNNNEFLIELYIIGSYFIITLPNHVSNRNYILPQRIGYITGAMTDEDKLYVNNDYIYIKSNYQNKNKPLEIKAFGDHVGNIKHLSIKKFYVISNNSNIMIHKYKNILNPSSYEEFKKNNNLTDFEYSNSRNLLINKNMIYEDNINSFIPNDNIIILSNLEIYENNINEIDCKSDLLLQSRMSLKSINESITLKIKQNPSRILNLSDSIVITNEWHNLDFKLYELEINANENIEFSIWLNGGDKINMKIKFSISCSTHHKPIERITIVNDNVKPTNPITVKPSESVTIKPTESNDPIPKYSGMKQFIIFICGILLLIIILYCLYRKANHEEDENEYVSVVQDPEEAEHFLDASNN